MITYDGLITDVATSWMNSIFAHKDFYQMKIFQNEPFQKISEKQKVCIFVHAGTTGLKFMIPKDEFSTLNEDII